MIRPLAGYVLIQPSVAETTTSSGIYVPETSQEKPARGRVAAIGSEIIDEEDNDISCPVKVGEEVVYIKWSTNDIKLDGTDYKLVKFTDLMGVIE